MNLKFMKYNTDIFIKPVKEIHGDKSFIRKSYNENTRYNKNNKYKSLYESIINSIAKEVKKVLNEDTPQQNQNIQFNFKIKPINLEKVKIYLNKEGYVFNNDKQLHPKFIVIPTEYIEGKTKILVRVFTIVEYTSIKDNQKHQIVFYTSSGSGGKKEVSKGKWYPIFGIEKGCYWLYKTHGVDMAFKPEGAKKEYPYGYKELGIIKEWLDTNYGDIDILEKKWKRLVEYLYGKYSKSNTITKSEDWKRINIASMVLHNIKEFHNSDVLFALEQETFDFSYHRMIDPMGKNGLIKYMSNIEFNDAVFHAVFSILKDEADYDFKNFPDDRNPWKRVDSLKNVLTRHPKFEYKK